MASLKYFSLILRSLITLIVIFGFLLVMLNYMNVSFKLDGARQALVEQIESYTGRDVRIDGELKLTVSFPPQLLVERIHISNIDNIGEEDFINISQVRIEVPLLPLLSGQLYLQDISADHAKLNLIKKKDGSDNWSFEKKIPQAEIKANPEARDRRTYQLTMGVFQLTDVTVIYNDESRDQIIKQQLDRLIIDIKDRAEPIAEISGKVQGYPYSLIFESDALDRFPAGEPWLLHGKGKVAGSQTELEAILQLKENEINAKVDIDVKTVNIGLLLETLGIITGQDSATDNINIKARVQGSDLTELYQKAEISLQLGKGYWNLQSTAADEKKELSFSSASSFTSWHKPVALHLDGTLAGEAIKLDLKTNRLLEFFDDVKKLDIDLVSSIAGTDIALKGTLDLPIITKQFNLDLAVKGKDLEKLNPVIDTDFPAFNDFSLSGKLIANERGYILKSAKASIGETQLQTSIVIDTTSLKPYWTINLSSRELQLKDFAFYDLESKQVSITSEQTSTNKTNDKPYLEPLRVLQATVDEPDMHLGLNLKVDKLMSGEDILGKARFKLELRDHAISLENADIEFPGGRITASLSFRIEDSKASGHAILNIDKLDYGITTRLFKPDSQVDGTISIRSDIDLAGSGFTRLLDNATGQLDIAVWPKNTKPAKILNLWATNLYLVLLPELKKKESKVNCLVSLMNLDKGIMKEEFFAIDTTKLWIYGNFNVDFKQEHVKLSLFPRSKTARLFELSSPVRAQGSFSEIGLEINPVDLITGYISFITSPLTVPTRWIFGDKAPEDGSAVCEQFFDRAYVEKLNKEIKQKQQKEVDEMLGTD